MNFLTLSFGRSDDVDPFIGISAALKARGHSVTLGTNSLFEEPVRAAGLDFIRLGTRQELLSLMEQPDFWHPRNGIALVIQKGLRPMLRPVFECVRDFAERQKVVVLASWNALGARLAQEKHGIPLITIHQEPEAIASVDAPPVYAGENFSRWPRWLRKWAFRVTERLADRLLHPEFSQFRGELGLPPVHAVFSSWMHSPQLTLGLWPEWYAPPQRDWPPHVRLTNFPLYEGPGIDHWPDRLDAFLKEGPPPVAFTLGANMPDRKLFFGESVEACRLTNSRCIWVASHSGQLPESLPPNVQAVGPVSLRRLLPKIAALVHPGGVATTGHALAAGIPQVVMPRSFDQPDNADRLERLGVGLTLPPTAYGAENLARLLSTLNSDPSYHQRAQALRQRLPDKDGIALTCDVIEQFASAA